MERWSGKTAVVTGASSGIGAALAVALADAGLRVVGLARRPYLVDALKSQVQGCGSIVSRQCDVAKPDEVSKTFHWIDQHFGSVAVMVNNAGVFHVGHMTEVGDAVISEDDLLSTIDINVKGAISCTRRAVDSMKRYGTDGHIININSIAGHYVPMTPTFNVYPASKHALTAITACLSKELAHFNCKIKTTCISPGAVETAMGGPLVQKHELSALQPRDIAEAVIYALSTPPHVNVNELTLTATNEKWL